MSESWAPSAPVMLHRIPCVRAGRGWPGADGGYTMLEWKPTGWLFRMNGNNIVKDNPLVTGYDLDFAGGLHGEIKRLSEGCWAIQIKNAITWDDSTFDNLDAAKSVCKEILAHLAESAVRDLKAGKS